MTRPHLSILQKVKALDEFAKQSKAKNNTELGLIARTVLQLDYTPSEAAVRRWKLGAHVECEECSTPFDLSDIKRTVNEINVDAENVEPDVENDPPGPIEEPNDRVEESDDIAETDDEIIMGYNPPKKRKVGQQLLSDYFNNKS